MKKILLSLTMLCAIFPHIQCQVTIGSLKEPIQGALLDLKDRDAASPLSVTDLSNITSTTGGLGLSRVQLVNLTTLEPFIPNDIDWMNNTDGIKNKYAGLMVYNIRTADPAETDPDKFFQPGIYIWDGSRWKREGCELQKEILFNLQPFNLPLNTGVAFQTFSLYEEYKRQFSKSSQNPVFVSSNASLEQILSGNNKRLYNSNELDFAVTFYDDGILTVNSIDASGLMTYTAKQSQPGSNPKVLINVVLVIK